MRSFPLIAASAALLLSAVPALADPFSFVVLGPAPHVAPEGARVALRVNEAAPDLVLHMGVARPAAGCDAEALRRRTMYLGAFDAPTMVVAGKGDRLACAMVRGRPDQPLEAHYEAVHPVPWLSQGRRKAVLRNAWAEGRPDDASLMRDGVAFITVGTGDPSVAADWVRAAMAEAGAQGATALAVALPAPLDAPELIPVARALTEAATAFGKPVLALQPAEDGAAEISLSPGEAPNLTVLSAPNAQNGPLTQVFVRPGLRAPFAFSVAPSTPQTATAPAAAARGRG